MDTDQGFRVLDAASPEGREEWIALWREWPDREVMAHPDYVRLFARPVDRGVALVAGGRGRAILFPLVLRPLAAEPWARPGEARWDAITPYGYGGPFAWNAGPAEAATFWSEYRSWCREERLVATFARLSLFPQQLAPIEARIEVRAPNVVRSLEGSLDEIWRDYSSKVRKNVNAAERAGLTVEIDQTGSRLEEFLAVYRETMTRRGADDRYLFPREFFESTIERLAPHFAFFHVLSGGSVVSTELVLCSERHLYSFLGGTLAEAFALRPNDLLKHHIVKWGVAQGKRAFVLGGGYAAGDGIFRYKLAFAPRGEVPFRVASLVHDEGGYSELVAARAAEVQPDTPRPDYFPTYRA